MTSQVSMDITIENKFIGTITIGLFGDDSPKTVENFRTICIKGIDGRSYNGTKFHRVIDRFIIQGDLNNKAGKSHQKWNFFLNNLRVSIV